MADISQTTLSDALFFNDNICILIKIWLKFAPWIWLTILQYWFRWWVGAVKATGNYLKQCWRSSLTHIRVKTALNMLKVFSSTDIYKMTSSNGNIFRAAGHLWGEWWFWHAIALIMTSVWWGWKEMDYNWLTDTNIVIYCLMTPSPPLRQTSLIHITYLIRNKIEWVLSGTSIVNRWMPHDLNHGELTLVHVMAWCRQAASHYQSQYWSRPFGVITRPQCYNPFASR